MGMGNSAYDSLLGSIGRILQEGRKHAFYAVNSILVRTYWEIGKQIAGYEQRNKERRFIESDASIITWVVGLSCLGTDSGSDSCT